MNKARFVMNTLKALEKSAQELVEKYGNKVNGNAFNKVWRTVDAEARATGFWSTGKISMYSNKDGSIAYVQEGMPSWQNILKNYINLAQK